MKRAKVITGQDAEGQLQYERQKYDKRTKRFFKDAPVIPGFSNEFQEDVPAPATHYRGLRGEKLLRARVSKRLKSGPPVVQTMRSGDPKKKEARATSRHQVHEES